MRQEVGFIVTSVKIHISGALRSQLRRGGAWFPDELHGLASEDRVNRVLAAAIDLARHPEHWVRAQHVQFRHTHRYSPASRSFGFGLMAVVDRNAQRQSVAVRVLQVLELDRNSVAD